MLVLLAGKGTNVNQVRQGLGRARNKGTVRAGKSESQVTAAQYQLLSGLSNAPVLLTGKGISANQVRLSGYEDRKPRGTSDICSQYQLASALHVQISHFAVNHVRQGVAKTGNRESPGKRSASAL